MTTFIDQTTVIQAAWLNSVDTAVNTTLPAVQTTANAALPSATAASTYLTQANAASTYATIGSVSSQIQPVSATVATNALTVTLAATTLTFRSNTLTSGTNTQVTVGSPISVVVPSTATLGTTNAVQSTLVVLAINNAGTAELAVVNLVGGADLSETGVISTTTISGAATASNVFYSTTARTNVAYRVVGTVTSTQATAGTWATAPSLIQGMGGNAYKTVNTPQSFVRVNTNGAAAAGYGSTNTAIRRFTTIVSNVGPDITYADSATLGASFTINTNGIYAISHSDSYGSGNLVSGISKNSASLTTSMVSLTATEVLAVGSNNSTNAPVHTSVTVPLVAGDVIRPHGVASANTGTVPSQFTITRIA